MAEGFVAGMAYATFKDDNLHLYAVVRCLEIISEASRRLPDASKVRHPSIEWRDIAGAARYVNEINAWHNFIGGNGRAQHFLASHVGR